MIILRAVTILQYHHRRLMKIVRIQLIHYGVEYGLKVNIATEVVRLFPDFL